MTVTVANLPYDFCPTAQAQSTQGFMFKNAYDAWFYNNATATATQITDIDYPGYHTYSVTSLTSSSTTATAEIAAGHGVAVNDSVTIAGATPSAYNGTYTVKTVADSTHFTYTFAGGTSPATGTITAVGGRVTVPGIVFIDGYFAVMDTNATIRTCNLNDAMSWNALDFLTAQTEPGVGKAIAKTQNYVIAFKEWSTEFFYDAGNATGSPLSPAGNGFNLIGCASGASVANLDGTLIWVSQTRQKGRSVHIMQGLAEDKISTPDVERVLNLSTLATVHSFGVKIAGHAFYVLTLVDLNITLVCDLTSKIWSQWSSLTAGSPVSVTSITLSGTIATVTCGAAHNLLDGDPVNIAGANQAAYNGIKVISYVSATVFTFEIPTATNKTITSLTSVTTTATATSVGHGLTNGQTYTIAGASPSAYNGDYAVTVTGSDTLTYTFAGGTSPATGTILVYNPVLTATGTITSTPYTETYFKYTKYIHAFNKDLLQHESNGTLCELVESAYSDVGNPVNVLIRTGEFDGGNTQLKRFSTLSIIGNKVSGTAYVRYSGDDYTTYSKYRAVDLSADRSKINRLGADRRRSFDVRYLDATALQLSELEVN